MNKIAFSLFVLTAAFCRASIPSFLTVGSFYQFHLASSPEPFTAQITKIDESGWIEVATLSKTVWLNVAVLQAVGDPHYPAKQTSAVSGPAPARTVVLPKSSEKPSASNIGVLGIDARWSEYGEYMQEMLEVIQTQWKRTLTETPIASKKDTRVSVTFKLNSTGGATVLKVNDAAGASNEMVSACLSAITARRPYRKWSSQMVAVLGEEQQITLGFYYQ